MSLSAAHSRALAASGRVRLPLRSRVWRGQAGEFAGGGTGSSMDFQDHRAYSPGDDPRHINWQAYARTGSYTMKLFREEVRPVVDLILDASESMFFTPEKLNRTAELLYFFAESSLSAGASIHIHAVRGDASLTLDPATLRNHSWLDKIRALTPTQGDHSNPAAPEMQRLPLRANAIRVFLSDLLFPADPEPILRHLGQRQGSLMIFAPFLQSEATPDWSGNYEFIDAESQGRHPHRIEPAILKRYRESYSNHFAIWKQQSNRHQTPFARIPCELDLITALYQAALPINALESV
ncbi:DUF58 domain-containing protein [Luteolibacter pohnpeiensis]|uniref:DUF58 domain-containing protein n=1 Tax=Luteolibacter pohnpeiensis TaxID=454153 RepID=A0A934SD14_9BACT|nr:DUF58 domain-containing protein [Luteolibacter pohnpeiensis]MBK1883629.1 DUF58 domain-containing protein [Luteolibacter pohnpeiensis]